MSTAEISAPDTPLSLPQVEAELARQLNLNNEKSEAPTQRARMSNLVVFCDDEEHFQQVKEAVPSIVASHPARVLLAYQAPGHPDNGLTCYVNAWCALGPHRVKICSEEVTLRAQGRGVDHLPYAVRSLLVGDLPTNLWWASRVPPPLAGSLLNDLAEHCQQILFDSLGWLDPARGMVATATWMSGVERGALHGWRVVSDLNWRRLKFWRRILAQALDPASCPGALETITEVVVEHGPHAVIGAWELASWLASRLGWQVSGGRVEVGKEIAWQMRAPHGQVVVRIHRLAAGPPQVHRVRLACALAGKPGALNVVAEGDNRLSVQLEGAAVEARTLTVQAQPLEELIIRQLSDREHDPVFHESMEVAGKLARTLLE